MTLGASIPKKKLIKGSFWQLKENIHGYANRLGSELSTQVCAGRSFEVLSETSKKVVSPHNLKRIFVKLLEDGYLCWIDFAGLNEKVLTCANWKPRLLDTVQILKRIPSVIEWIENAAQTPNHYLWGGTIGPDFDCSGLIQSAFASQGVWLPRDAYQQEEFSKKVFFTGENYQGLAFGDLLFFGTASKCTHVGIYINHGLFWHSSGPEDGNNGIASNQLFPLDTNKVACHYRAMFRGAGRVTRCHDGTTLK